MIATPIFLCRRPPWLYLCLSNQDLPNLLVVYIGLVFDVINACQGVVMFIVVAFDSTTITKFGFYFTFAHLSDIAYLTV